MYVVHAVICSIRVTSYAPVTFGRGLPAAGVNLLVLADTGTY